MRLLLVEDSERLAGFLRAGLQSAGFTVDLVGTVDEAMAGLGTARFDAVVLDLGLPDGDGLAVLKALRASGDATPVLILTARDELPDRLEGLNGGADDYLIKPFELAELVARLRALLRRPGGVLGLCLQLGNLSFDTIARMVQVDDRPLALPRRELDLLEFLLRRVGRVVTKGMLEEGMYGFDEEVESNSVEVHISRLRKKLAAAGATPEIHTVRGVGYFMSEPAA